ncbi:MAG: TonB-dependent receptor [Acidobacteria bacterium]|nr:MAG: TonB-dependent receptor [Acidobacteriota bacterium]
MLVSPALGQEAARAGADAADRDVPAATRREPTVVVRADAPPVDAATRVTRLSADELLFSTRRGLDGALLVDPAFALFRESPAGTSHPTVGAPSLRGLAPTATARTLVLLDGIPIHDTFGGWVAWSRLPRLLLDGAVLSRAGGPTALGEPAPAGTIRFATRTTRPGELLVDADAGERGAGSVAALTTLRVGVGRLALEAGTERTGRVAGLRSDQRGPIDRPLAGSASRVHLRWSGTVGGVPFGVMVNAFRDERSAGTPLAGSAARGGLLAMTARWTGPRLGLVDLAIDVRDDRLETRFSRVTADRAAEVPVLFQDAAGGTGAGMRLSWSPPFRGVHAPVLHVVARAADGELAERFRFVPGPSGPLPTRRRLVDARAGRLSVSLADTMTCGRTRVLAGLRADALRRGRGTLTVEALDGSAPATVEPVGRRTRWQLSPWFGLVREPRRGVRLFARVEADVREPTMNELYRPFRVGDDVTAPDPDLAPERAVSVEIGGAISGRGWSVSASAFSSRIDDAIVNVTRATGSGTVIAPCGFVPAGGVCRQRANVHRGRVLGLEADASLRLAGTATVRAALALQDTALDVPADAALDGRRFPQVPSWRASLSLATGAPRGGGSRVLVRAVGARWEDDRNTRPLGGFVTVDLAHRWRLADSLLLVASAENVLDREIVTGVRADGLVAIGPPRTLRVRLVWSPGTGR